MYRHGKLQHSFFIVVTKIKSRERQNYNLNSGGETLILGIK